MKHRLVAAAAIAASMSCSHVSQPEKFTLPQGEATVCLRYHQEACGMALEGCGLEHTVNFTCLTNVSYEGPTEDPPAIYDETKDGKQTPVQTAEPENTQGK